MLRKFKNLFHLLQAIIAATYYGFPGNKLFIIGVTGTDGKTSTCHLIYEILKNAGKKVALISTVSAIIDGKEYDTGFHVTTPSPFIIQKYLKQAMENKIEYLVLEITSHALDQHRIWGNKVDIGLITNINHEHIDYHKTLLNYRNAKLKLVKISKIAILNRDDPNYHYLKKSLSGKKIVSFGFHKNARVKKSDLKIKNPIPGDFHFYNMLAAYSVVKEIGIDKKTVMKVLQNFKGIKGRLEEVTTDKKYRVFIDFAHKPNALKEIIKTARNMTKNRVIVVFGCAGLRDVLKRPMMGEIAAKLADLTVLTAEDPRTEDVRNIINEISQGCIKGGALEINKFEFRTEMIHKNKKYFIKISDRQEAINFTLRKLAGDGDIVLLCGKGHEKSMCYGKIEYPWDEHLAVEKAIYGTV
jgi:UDP-N-acetylmuramoyl-L-alanyl-D-glutamate--2,6-diaminopimelate ligase